MGLRILVNELKGRVPRGCLCAGREGSCGYEPAHTRGLQAVGGFMWMDDSFNFTPAEVVSSQHYFKPILQITFCGWKLVYCTRPVLEAKLPWWYLRWVGTAKGWVFFLELKWQHILPQINFKLPMFISFNQDDKNSTDNFLHCSFNFFFFFFETQNSWLALDIYCLTYRSITPSVLAWTVYHCTLNSF